MAGLPRISVVTSSYNHGRFIGRTIDSVLAQNYPNCEHIIVDGMSTDDTPTVLARYPHLRVVREPDTGQANAINKGFRRATGNIFCFLNSDDTFLPGALHRVARALDPAQGRHIVMGRCIYVDEEDRPTGREHPSAFVSHRRVLEVWKTHCIPQPATFWTAAVWNECGPLDEREHLVPDYELFCRFSRRYHFHPIDQVLATYRLHTVSKTCSHGEEQIGKEARRVSRRYWGSPAGLGYWRMLGSYLNHHRVERADRLTARAFVERGNGRHLTAAVCALGGILLAPEQAVRRTWRHLAASLNGVPAPDAWLSQSLDPETRSWRSFVGVHADRCVGPRLCLPFRRETQDDWLELDGSALLDYGPDSREFELLIDDCPAARTVIGRRPFSVRVNVQDLTPGEHVLEIVADSFIVPHDYLGNGDKRPLSFRFRQLRLGRDQAETSARPGPVRARLATGTCFDEDHRS